MSALDSPWLGSQPWNGADLWAVPHDGAFRDVTVTWGEPRVGTLTTTVRSRSLDAHLRLGETWN